jgi:hypothetical protein
LVQLGALQKVKADRRTYYSRYAHTGQSSSKSFLKVLQRTQPGKFRRYDSSLRRGPILKIDARDAVRNSVRFCKGQIG